MTFPEAKCPKASTLIHLDSTAQIAGSRLTQSTMATYEQLTWIGNPKRVGYKGDNLEMTYVENKLWRLAERSLRNHNQVNEEDYWLKDRIDEYYGEIYLDEWNVDEDTWSPIGQRFLDRTGVMEDTGIVDFFPHAFDDDDALEVSGPRCGEHKVFSPYNAMPCY